MDGVTRRERAASGDRPRKISGGWQKTTRRYRVICSLHPSGLATELGLHGTENRRSLGDYLPAAMAAAIPRHDPYASLRIPEFPLVHHQPADDERRHPAPGRGGVLADLRAHARPAVPRPHRPGRGAALHRVRAAGRAPGRSRSRGSASRGWSLVALLACSLSLLWFTVQPGMLHPGRVWPIYVVIFLSGIARSFLQPSRTALSAEVVPRPLYPNAVTWRSSTWQLAAVLGPALGGLIYGFGNATAAYVGGRVAHARGARRDRPHPPRPAGAGPLRRVGAREPRQRRAIRPGPARGARRARARPVLGPVRRRHGAACRSSPTRSCTWDRRGWACFAPLPAAGAVVDVAGAGAPAPRSAGRAGPCW